ncbi:MULTISPECIES: nicotinate-nucleotide adenylyltransferase [unclassified Romboutsia]|uniref:nicotinate-nucleotide adenylyltransferase n=1 Tax=unclassified Romboutsia TaxID=2626894 RepID=UPI0008227CB2|nr:MULTISPECIES: nicotinate-nucleotide adenylyltransferase [unclassified Romboutsia]SCH35800.1 Nicotinate-nucleotide adenylyltransferase [uncultured Clostridium sp.]
MSIEDLLKRAKDINTHKLEQFKNSDSKLRIGIMGGTFDPIHYAHLATAEFIRDKYKLDKIIFIPTGNPPHKLENVTNKYDRYNMVLISTRNNENFIVLDFEIENENKTYTVDTLRHLKKEYNNCEIFFITGADAICDIETWKEVEENFKLATFIAATRPGISLLEAQEKIENLEEKYNAKIISVYVPSLDISSTYIRQQLKSGKSVKYLLPENVEKYMREKNLYKIGVK